MPFNKNQTENEQIAFFVERVQELIKAKCNEDIVRLGLCATGFVDRASQGASISSYFQQQAVTVDSKSSSTTRTNKQFLSSKSSSGPTTVMSKKNNLISSLIQEKKPKSQLPSKCSSVSVAQKDSVLTTQREVDISNNTDIKLHDNNRTTISDVSSSPSSKKKDLHMTKTSAMKSHIVHEVGEDPSPDLAYAMKLQASYDRENEILSKIERGFGVTKKSVGRFSSSSSSSSSSSLQRQPKKSRIDSYFKLKK